MATTRLHSHENISLAVECPACGDFSETPLTLLESADHVDCPACGGPIDIDDGPIRAEINRLVERCALMDVPTGGK